MHLYGEDDYGRQTRDSQAFIGAIASGRDVDRFSDKLPKRLASASPWPHLFHLQLGCPRCV